MTQPNEATPLQSAQKLVADLVNTGGHLTITPAGASYEFKPEGFKLIQTALDNAYAAGAERMREEAAIALEGDEHLGKDGFDGNYAAGLVRKLPTEQEKLK